MPNLVFAAVKKPFSPAITVFAGGEFSMAEKADVGYSWGENTQGQLGINSTVSRSTPGTICGNYLVSELAGGTDTAFLITTAGVEYAWGDNATGELGDNTVTDKSTPVAVCGGFTFTHIDAGYTHQLV